MSGYPWGLETKADVCVDADDVLDYVKSNKEWFLEKLGNYKSNETVKNEVKDLGEFVDSIIDKYNKVRIFRDASSNNTEEEKVKIYEDLIEIRESISKIAK